MKRKVGRPRKLTKDQVVEALTRCRGFVTVAADRLGVNYRTLIAYIDRDPRAQNIVEHFREARRDRAEVKLDEAIERGEQWAVVFALRNARDRGYGDRLTVDARVEKIEAYDYGHAIAAIAARPDSDRPASGKDQGAGDGPALGQDADER